MAGEVNCEKCGGHLALDCWGCNYHDMSEAIEEASKLGAAVAFGLMGMAVAIKKRQGYQEWMRITTHPARPISFDDEEPCKCGKDWCRLCSQ